MSTGLIQTIAAIGLISTLLAVVALLIVVGVGASYNPNKSQLYLVILVIGALIATATALFLVAKGLLGKKLPRGLEMSAVLLGLCLAPYGLYWVVVDFGDILLYIWLVLLGASLSIVAYVESSSEKRET